MRRPCRPFVTAAILGSTAAGTYATTLREFAKLQPSDTPAGGEGFGYSSGIRGDVLIIGAPGDDDLASYAGAAYIFRRGDPGTPADPSDDAWIEEVKLHASDGREIQLFGWSVVIEGDYALVGAPAAWPSGAGPGAAYVFHRVAGQWTEQAKLTSPAGLNGDHFGQAVAIDGDTLVVGAPSDVDGRGRAYVYGRNGTAWGLQGFACPTGVSAEDSFGSCVALGGDVVIVGAYRDSEVAAQAGAAYAYRWNGSSWLLDAKPTAPDVRTTLFFGSSVATDGTRVLVGALRASGADVATGAAYALEDDRGAWTPMHKFWAGDGGNLDDFGTSAAVSGALAIVGSPADDDARPGSTNCDSGSAYLFTRIDQQWYETAKLVASDTTCAALFGRSVALHGATALVGQYLFDVSSLPAPPRFQQRPRWPCASCA
jgi:hypothetical protein